MKVNFVHPADIDRLLALRREKHLTARAFEAGVALATFADKQTGQAWPSMATLADRCSIDRRHLPDIMHLLESAGFMQRLAQGKGTQPAIYQIDRPENCSVTKEVTVAEAKEAPSVTKEVTASVTILGPCSLYTYMNEPRNEPVDEQTHAPAEHEPEPTEPQVQDTASRTDAPAQPQNGTQSDADALPGMPAPADTAEAHSGPKKRISRKAESAAPAATVTRTDAGFTIPDQIRARWLAACPGVDIDREAALAFSWCMDNPAKGNKKNYTTFLGNWIRRKYADQQERAQRNGQPPGQRVYTPEELAADYERYKWARELEHKDREEEQQT